MIKNFANIGDIILDVKCGISHTLATSQHGKVYSWGEGPGGKLGLGYSEALGGCPDQHYPKEINKRLQEVEDQANYRIKFVGCGRNISIILKETGVVKMIGKGHYQKIRFDDHIRYSLPF